MKETGNEPMMTFRQIPPLPEDFHLYQKERKKERKKIDREIVVSLSLSFSIYECLTRYVV